MWLGSLEVELSSDWADARLRISVWGEKGKLPCCSEAGLIVGRDLAMLETASDSRREHAGIAQRRLFPQKRRCSANTDQILPDSPASHDPCARVAACIDSDCFPQQ